MPGVLSPVPKLERLRAVRVSRLLTQAELAATAGVSRQTINRIEQGEIEPRFSTIKQLAAALGVEPAELIGQAEETGGERT